MMTTANAPVSGPQGQRTPESFLQRQKRLYGGATSPQPPAQPQNPQTPQTPQAPAAPAAPAQPAAHATSSGSSPVSSDGRIAPAAPAPAPQPQAPPPPPYNYAQYQAPQQQGLENQLGQQMSQMVANPHSMSNDNVAMLQAQQREQAALMAQQSGQQNAAQWASRGMAGGGQQDLGQRRLNDSLMSSVLGSNRDVMLQKMQQDRADELAVQQAGNAYLSNELGRSGDAFKLGLAGEQAQAEENFRNWSTGTSNDLQGRQLDIQQQLGQGGLNMDQSKLDEQMRQYNMGYGLDLQKFFENARQFDTGLTEQQRQYNGSNALDWSRLNSQNQNNLLNFLMSQK